MVSLPRSLTPELAQQVQFARAVWHRDRQNRIPVEMPHQLAQLARKRAISDCFFSAVCLTFTGPRFPGLIL